MKFMSNSALLSFQFQLENKFNFQISFRMDRLHHHTRMDTSKEFHNFFFIWSLEIFLTRWICNQWRTGTAYGELEQYFYDHSNYLYWSFTDTSSTLDRKQRHHMPPIASNTFQQEMQKIESTTFLGHSRWTYQEQLAFSAFTAT